MTAVVTVKASVLWMKHIHGDPVLRARLADLPAGEDIRLTVDGVTGYWRKMAAGRDGRPTAGLQPRGQMQDVWKALHVTRRGEDVPLSEPMPSGANLYPPLAATEEEREEALQRLLSTRFDFPPGWKFNRQEIYDERDDELASRREKASRRQPS